MQQPVSSITSFPTVHMIKEKAEKGIVSPAVEIYERFMGSENILEFSDTEEFKVAVAVFSKFADAGNGDATFRLGKINARLYSIDKVPYDYARQYFIFAGARKYDSGAVNKELALLEKEYLLKRHAGGDGEASYKIAEKYLCGEPEFPKDIAKAMEFYKTASDRKYALASKALATIHWQGNQVVPKSLSQAVIFCDLAIQQGCASPEDQKLFNQIKAERQTVVNRLIALETLSDNGDAEATYELALNRYLGRHDVRKDVRVAVQLFVKASGQGSSAASEQVAEIYLKGEGRVPQSFDQAVSYFDLSLQQGSKTALAKFKQVIMNYAPAQGDQTNFYQLGVDYLEGKDKRPKTDVEFIISLLKLAVNPETSHQVPGALEKLGDVYFEDAKCQDYTMYLTRLNQAIDCFTKVMEQSKNSSNSSGTKLVENKLNQAYQSKHELLVYVGANKDAALAYGQDHLNGTHGVTKDALKAMNLFARAAELEHKEGYYLASKAAKECKRADKQIEYVQKAAAAGHGDANSEIGVAYFEGSQFKKSNTTAIKYLEVALPIYFRQQQAEPGNQEIKAKLVETYSYLGKAYMGKVPLSVKLTALKQDNEDYKKGNHYLNLAASLEDKETNEKIAEDNNSSQYLQEAKTKPNQPLQCQEKVEEDS